jgi:LuxR family transcriptional regulator, quorum-sensing system regulator BjaR1
MELRYLSMIAQGYRPSEIAQILGKSEETIKSALKSVRKKLEAKNTTNAVWIAIRKGLI